MKRRTESISGAVRRLGAAAALAATLVAHAGLAAEDAPARPGGHNHLAGSTSPYLLQHQDNPVDWYPWGPEAFAKAKKEGKPVFLSVGYSACHWCHVMERESFRDDGIADQLNQRFVCIKVDREERPDVDDLYMTAMLLLNGRGGWPLSAFLTPDGKPFHGGTYFPRDVFAELLRDVHAAWADPGKRMQIEEQADRLTRGVGETATARARAGTLTPQLAQSAAKQIREGLDERYGGFGGAPKFPPVMRLAVLLAEHRRKPDAGLLRAVTLTLDRMARGGIYDQLGGGFHRYSVDEKWQVPHFEKMLYDNALLAWIYLEAYRDTGTEEFARIGTETLDFALRELRDRSTGAFWSSLDAESTAADGSREEGAFYLWTPSQVTAALGPEDGALFCRVYGIAPTGTVQGKSVPNLVTRSLDEWAKELKLSPAALRTRLEKLQTRLQAAREKRSRPRVDDKVLANWNGLMLRALAAAYDHTGDVRYKDAAEANARFLLAELRKDGKLRHSYRAGKTQPQVFLEDYSFVAAGMLELHRATGEERWLKEAGTLARTMVDDFWNETRGTFDSTPRGHESLIARRANVEEDSVPSGQSMAAQVLLQLGRRTSDAALREKAQRTLDAAATEMKRTPHVVAGMVAAAQAYFVPDAQAEPPRAARTTVTATLEGVPPAIRPGQDLELVVRLRLASGWHVNADRPGVAGRIPTRVELEKGPFKLLGITYPAPEPLRVTGEPQPVQVFSGETLVRVKLRALPGSEKDRPRLKVRYQACNDQVCDAPREVLLTGSAKE
jgi:uncharacterized protein YyaL (SSP411 family)